MRIVHDIECLPNFFSIAIVDYDSDREWSFEISERRNDTELIKSFYKDVKYAIGFNSIHYDDIVINYLKQSKFKDWLDCTKSLKLMSDWIINDKYDLYKKYKYNVGYNQIDLYLYWSKMLRQSKKLSLKSIAINVNWYLIKEFPLKHTDYIKLEQIDEFLEYNFNDAYITKHLANLFKDKINLRTQIQKEYGINCLSKDSIKIASDILSKAYSEESGLSFEEYDTQTKRDYIKLKDILLPFEFKENEYKFYYVEGKIKIANDEFEEEFGSKIQCCNFYTLYNHLLNKTVSTTKEIAYSLNVVNPDKSNLHIDVLSGGIHGIIDKTIIEKNDDEVIIDSDIASMYPNIIANHEFVPQHLDKQFFLNTYKGLIQKRIKAKKLSKDKSLSEQERNKYTIENEALKLCLNGTYGLFNNDYSWLKDMQVTLSTTINGQLILCKLTELCIDNEISVLMLNTDGLTVKMNKDKEQLYYQLVKQVEEQYKIEFEHVYYSKIIAKNINNYLAFYTDGKIKEKGETFITKPEIGNSNDAIVIPKALQAYYKNNVKPEDFITNHTNIFDFCFGNKIDRKYKVMWNNQQQQQLNRYYVSKKGYYLYKIKEGKKTLENVLKGFAVQLYNQHIEKPMSEYDIDYSYYIAECYKIINDLKPKQKLF
jgi:hypothetical protein